jgi:ribonuclease HI
MKIYTDGSCSGNGNAENTGGFSVVIVDDDDNLVETYSRSSKNTTNNREELKAILYAFLRFGTKGENISTIYSDSSYSINTYTTWMFGWAKNDWVKSDKKTPENLDIIKEFYTHWQKGYRIHMRHVRGHAENKWNNIADKLAVQATNGKEERYVAK